MSFPYFLLLINLISTTLLTVFSSLLMLHKSSNQTKHSQPSMLSADVVGVDCNPIVLGEKEKKRLPLLR